MSLFKSNEKLSTISSFDDMDLKTDILRGIYGYGYEEPSSIQKVGIMPMCSSKRDIIAQAQSGTGKTGTFTIASLQILDPDIKETQILVLSPTRELANQTYEVFQGLGKYVKCKMHLCMGGTNRWSEINYLKKNKPQIIIATPGRCFDMIKEGVLDITKLKLNVLDEADEMLNIGFKKQLYDIFEFIPEETQMCLFSATMPKDVLVLAKKFMRTPITILLKDTELTLEGIHQFYLDIHEEQNKFLFIVDTFKTSSFPQSIIFCNSRRKVEWLRQNLPEALDTDADFIAYVHGDMSHKDRTDGLRDFKTGSKRLLISSELLSRGIDIQQVSLVINYDLPRNKNNYIHRIGRSGRWGRKGTAISLITYNEHEYLNEIQSFFNTEIRELPQDFAKYIR